jgi:hypothetical protein
MIKKYFVIVMLGALLAACTATKHQEYNPKTGKIYIDGEEWLFTLGPTHCEAYADVAVEEYLKNPIFNANRALEHNRYLVNEEGACWVEIEAVGASDLYFLFRVNEDLTVVEKRMFAERPPHINDYPTEPYEK